MAAMLDFKNLLILSFSPCRHAVLLPHTISVDELWPKKSIFKMAAAAIFSFKNFNFWSCDCHGVQYLL